MPMLNDLIDGDAQRLDTGFTFTEGPLYHPNGFYYFVDVRESKFYRIKPGEKAELLRENTGEGNGMTFDPQGRLIQCEGGNRRVTLAPVGDGEDAGPAVVLVRAPLALVEETGLDVVFGHRPPGMGLLGAMSLRTWRAMSSSSGRRPRGPPGAANAP